MYMKLRDVRFNHDKTSASHDALSLRENAAAAVDDPEWQHGVSKNPEDSLAAYVLKDTTQETASPRPLTIQAAFVFEHPEDFQDLYIRAVAPAGITSVSFHVWLQWVRKLLVAGQVVPTNILGNVAEQLVHFYADGTSDRVRFDLPNVYLWDVGAIGIFHLTWQWQYREPSSTVWINFDVSRHRIYSVLEEPKAPWTQYETQPETWPWTDVLDFACLWASGAQTLYEDAARQVTEKVNGLSSIKYDCPHGGHPFYTPGTSFNCTKFVERLRGGIGKGPYVNCSDCAAIVSTFSNALGCELSQWRMGEHFLLNPFIAIGYSNWHPGCANWLNKAFRFHEVAWRGNCTADDLVFDACLKLDADSDPRIEDLAHTALLPTNIRFGAHHDREYRFRLERLQDNLSGGSYLSQCNPIPADSGITFPHVRDVY